MPATNYLDVVLESRRLRNAPLRTPLPQQQRAAPAPRVFHLQDGAAGTGYQRGPRGGRSDQQGLRSGGVTKQIKPGAKKISEKLTEQIQSLRKEQCIAVGTGQVCSPLTPLILTCTLG